MRSLLATPNKDHDASNDAGRTDKPCRKSEASISDKSVETTNEALRKFRERIKQSTCRPKWWSDHMRGFFH